MVDLDVELLTSPRRTGTDTPGYSWAQSGPGSTDCTGPQGLSAAGAHRPLSLVSSQGESHEKVRLFQALHLAIGNLRLSTEAAGNRIQMRNQVQHCSAAP